MQYNVQQKMAIYASKYPTKYAIICKIKLKIALKMFKKVDLCLWHTKKALKHTKKNLVVLGQIFEIVQN